WVPPCSGRHPSLHLPLVAPRSVSRAMRLAAEPDSLRRSRVTRSDRATKKEGAHGGTMGSSVLRPTPSLHLPLVVPRSVSRAMRWPLAGGAGFTPAEPRDEKRQSYQEGGGSRGNHGFLRATTRSL